jgi:dienelactone hydrolase
MIRSIYRSLAVPNAPAPFDRIYLKVFYPAKYGDTPAERDSGVIPVDAEVGPLPVVVFFSGVNCPMEGYRWLAMELAQAGFVVATFDWIAQDLPGRISLTPGVNIAQLRPDTYGKAPTGTAIASLSLALQELNQEGILAGALDLSRIALGGHSAGGSIALQNANPAWFAGVRAVFTYGAHTQAATFLGWQPDTVLPIPAGTAYLLTGGTRDGVIAASRGRYESGDSHPLRPIRRTYELASTHATAYFAEFSGANHFMLVHPIDETTGRPFLDLEPTIAPTQSRATFVTVVKTFLSAHLQADFIALKQLHQWQSTPPVAVTQWLSSRTQ